MKFTDQLRAINRGAKLHISDMKPSEWTEAHRVLTSDTGTRFPGPFRYDHTPYLREIVDCLSPYHPSTEVVFMKGSQIGGSTGVIEAGIGWIISESPGPILFVTGHSELTEIAMQKKIDQMIEGSGIQHLIRPNVVKKKNQRTGDTSKSKEFPGGYLIAGTASNHKMMRQISVRYGFLDDYESVKGESTQSGKTDTMIMRRFAAFRDNRKVFKISTPEIKQTSNIEPAYLEGDQRRYFVPCPCCAVPIILYWSTTPKHPKHKDQRAGVTWELDDKGELKPDSVGYVCQECGGFFDDSHKKEMLAAGEWVPTATPKRVGIYSYHLSSLYAPPGHDRWVDYAYEWLKANPPGGKRQESLHQTFLNTILGETYMREGASPEANSIQKNTRSYKIGTIPEWQSTKDGNGRIVILTCACDMNGREKDGRLDYEIVAWSESGSSYSVQHGSIGTFIPKEGQIAEEDRVDRKHWTYEHKKENSVWPEFEKILGTVFETDTGRKMRIAITGLDTGHFTQHAYAFIEHTRIKNVYGIKGDKEGKFRKYGIDQPLFKPGKERSDLWLLDVNHIKDEIADMMELEWQPRESQPPGFMNFPQPSGGLYLYKNYFSHFEAEHRIDDYDKATGEMTGQKWEKKDTNKQNHFWDVYVYNYILKDILAAKALKESPLKKGNWADFVKWILK